MCGYMPPPLLGVWEFFWFVFVGTLYCSSWMHGEVFILHRRDVALFPKEPRNQVHSALGIQPEEPFGLLRSLGAGDCFNHCLAGFSAFSGHVPWPGVWAGRGLRGGVWMVPI